MTLTPTELSQRLLDWYDHHGRQDLPWKQDPTPYRVWVSEVMLQQTQVATVVPYFERFMAAFPDLARLAAAPLDAVLHLWTGLGYYTRARNLHQAAQLIVAEHGGHFPTTLEAVVALPGIGRSTAGAILAQALGQHQTILDGNVKRVLTRLYGIDGWPGEKAVETRLWQLAEALTPSERVADYTQAIMDLGATLCRRGRPDCPACPFHASCEARLQGRQGEWPTARPKKAIPTRATQMLLLVNPEGEVLLEPRPPSGVWGGLWSLPESELGEGGVATTTERLGLAVEATEAWPSLRHTFSHFHLEITPLLVRVRPLTDRVMEPGSHVWYDPHLPDARGLAAPVVKLLQRLQTLPRAEHVAN